MKSIPSDLAQSTLDAAPDALIVIDVTGKVRFANRQVSALFGYRHDEVVGQPIEMLMPARFRDRHVSHRSTYAESGRARPMGAGLELFGQRRDGEEFPVEISLSPIQDKEEALVAAAIRDVTERKRAEKELIAARQAAERAREIAEDSRQAAEIARLAADRSKEIADQARDIADRANLGKSRFLATASHDLRQPLQTLSLLNGTMRRIVTDPDATEILDQEEHAIAAMSRLLNALLDISKLESGAIKPDPTDFSVSALFRALRADFANLAQSKGLQLRIEECNDSVHSDRSLIEQVVRNLVSNAIKYTREGYVALRCWHNPPSLVSIEVLDTGIGIPADQLRFIYDEFYQVGVPANSSRDGYGLGLSIVQRIVKLLDLRLDVRSEVGKGSVFSLTLPTAASTSIARSDPAQTDQPQQRRVKRPRVLLIEDDAAVRDATRMLFRVEGYHVTAVASVAEASGKLNAAEPFDLIVTDYHLANERGTEAISKLRELAGFPINAVLITGDTSLSVKEMVADAHLRIASKPIKADELLALMQELMGA